MKHLIVGASGQVGGALTRELEHRGEAVAGTYMSRPQAGMVPLDMRDAASTQRLVDDVTPDVIWIPGAMPDVDRCEREPDLSHAINVDGPKILLELAASRRIPLVYFSTDYVFDGTGGPYRENHAPRPLQVYGSHKLEAETALLQYDGTLIIRPAWIYSDEMNPRNFVFRVLTDLKAKRPIKAAVDQFNTPTPAAPLAQHAMDALIAGHRGILHLAGPERMSRKELVERIAALAGYGDVVVESVTLGNLPLPAQRPANGGLATNFPRFAILARLEDLNFRQILTGI